MAWLEELAAGTDALWLGDFGRSARGRPLPLVVYDEEGRFRPDEARADRVVVLVQACIHAGESCGKDAGMELLRDLVRGESATGILPDLEGVTLVFLPIFNVDGHDRRSPWGRINQNGPEQMGWRVTARNLNLNRDYMKADTVEMRAWLALYQAWLPDFFVDLHSTDGADYQYAVTYSVETQGSLDPGLTAWTATYEQAMQERMADQDWPIHPYVTYRRWHDPRSGLRTWASTPRFSQGYAAVQNRPGLLVETHMLKDYATRVAGAGRLLRETLAWVGGHADELRALNAAADAATAAAAFRAEPLALSFEQVDVPDTVSFLGVGYEIVTSEVSGGTYPRFDGGPETMTLEHFKAMRPAATADLPEAYLVPPEWSEVIGILAAHGVAVAYLDEPVELEVRTWRLGDPAWRQRPYEGRHPVTFGAEPLVETRLWPAGTAVVDLAQRTARVAAHLLEPAGPDALVGWGFFDAVFERVEYVESYVIEAMIPDLLAENPAWADELAARKAADPDFAADPWAIRQWFYERTPYYDQRVGIYPVACLDDRTVLSKLPLR